ncbi:MAG: TerD family protein [bacterium]|nr:TerD family protein [bacterium]
MTIVTGPEQGSLTSLNISQEGAKRFLVGLSWDPPELPGMKVKLADGPDDNAVSRIAHALYAPFEFLRVFFLSFANLVTFDMFASRLRKQEDKAGRDKDSDAYDLDLCCYIFDGGLKLLGVVETENDALFDASKKIYHTGEDQGGMGGNDDEVVYVETKSLPPEYEHLYFVVKSDSKYDLSQFNNPFVRLADSKTSMNALKNEITGKAKYNYVFCRVSRAGEGWAVQNIDACVDEDIDWATVLPKVGKV